MKIWFPVIKSGSGTDVYTRRLAEGLKQRGIGAEITWFHSAYEFAPFLLMGVPPPAGARIIHANAWNGFAFKRPGIPLIVTEHHCVLDPLYRPHKNLAQHCYHKFLTGRYILKSLRTADRITTVSRFSAESIERATGIGGVHVIHNFVDTEQFGPQLTQPAEKSKVFKLLFVGNLVHRKGADLLKPIMSRLGPAFMLHYTTGLRTQGLADAGSNMVPLGQLTDSDALVAAYNDCDALLLPTRFEGFGYAALEAMACGKPVIASNNSSIPEVVTDGITGILCPTNDIDCFVTACRTLAHQSSLCDRYGRAARQRVVEVFSERNIIPEYIALYEQLLDEQTESA